MRSYLHIGSRASQYLFHLIHGHSHAHWCLSVLFLLSFHFLPKFLFHLFLILAMVPDDSMNNTLCHSAIGSMVTFDYCTPDTGYEPKDMELGTNELNNAASGDIYFQDFLEDTVSLSNPDIDDDELAKLLAVVVDRTGQPVLERSDSDHFLVVSET